MDDIKRALSKIEVCVQETGMNREKLLKHSPDEFLPPPPPVGCENSWYG